MYDEIKEKTVILPPFKHFIMSVGEIPSSYLETMTYYEMLVWFTNYLGKTVIPAINENGEAVTELQNLFVELQTYVNNYFDNLDVQEEIDHKLDEMVEDGTFQTLVNTYAQPILANLTEDVNTALTTVNTLASEIETPIQKLRKEYYNGYSNFQLPVSLNSYFDKLHLYRSNDKQNFKYNLTKDDLPFETTVTKYVDNINGNNSNDGSTKALAYKTLTYAISQMAADTTFIVCNKIYYRNELPDTGRVINYSMNVIPEDGHCIFGIHDKLTWEQDSEYSNVYSASRSGVVQVVDIRGNENGAYALLENKETLQECAATKDTYYFDGARVYVNLGGEIVSNEKVLCELGVSNPPWKIESSSTELKLYFENVDFLCGNVGTFNILGNATYSPELRLYNCKILFNTNTSTDGLSLRGAKGLFMNTTIDRCRKDGFNYHAASGVKSYGIEINCIGSNNGRNSSDTYNNGTTAHDGCQVIRINGNYFGNKGGNVADVHDDTISININCNAYDSVANSNNGSDTDFVAQQSGAKLYLYNCFSKGSRSKYNLYATADNAYVYYDNCLFDTQQGEGVIELDD